MGSLLSLGHTRGSNGNKQPCTSIYNICLTFKYFCLILNSGRCNELEKTMKLMKQIVGPVKKEVSESLGLQGNCSNYDYLERCVF